MPPGCSKTSTNSRRAAANPSRPGIAPVSFCNISASFGSSAIAHSPSLSANRVAISAAAALVKVRHRIRPGGTPASNNLSNLSVSSLVLPEPAEASTQAEAAGSAAKVCASSARWRASLTLHPHRQMPIHPPAPNDHNHRRACRVRGAVGFQKAHRPATCAPPAQQYARVRDQPKPCHLW